MIKSILDTDLYKFTTSYAYMKLFSDAEGTFSFCDRDKTEYDENFVEMLQLALAQMGMVHLTTEEFNWVCENIRFIPQFYWEWLGSFHYDYNRIKVWLDDDKHLHPRRDRRSCALLYGI